MVRTLKLQNLKLAMRADSGLALGTIYPLNLTRNVLGRSVDVAVPVDDSKVSRIHAAVDHQNGFHYLVDLGSTNGTFLNDRRVRKPVCLSVGDRVRVGSASFVVELLENAKTQVGANWKEATRAILKDEAQRASPGRVEVSSVASPGAANPVDTLVAKARVKTKSRIAGLKAVSGGLFAATQRALGLKIDEVSHLGAAEDSEQDWKVSPSHSSEFLLTRHARWLSVAIAVLVVGAALATTLSRAS